MDEFEREWTSIEQIYLESTFNVVCLLFICCLLMDIVYCFVMFLCSLTCHVAPTCTLASPAHLSLLLLCHSSLLSLSFFQVASSSPLPLSLQLLYLSSSALYLSSSALYLSSSALSLQLSLFSSLSFFPCSLCLSPVYTVETTNPPHCLGN